MSWQIIQGDCLDVLPSLESASFDAIITDPPYPHIKREYGVWTADEWLAMMRRLVPELRRVLKPTGSCVMVLQPNSERVGRMRTWLWEFMAEVGKEWGIVQDAYWWNPIVLPNGGAPHRGLMRPSVKPCVWLGEPACYRNQDAVLWSESERNAAYRQVKRAAPDYDIRVVSANGVNNVKRTTCAGAAERRGGVTPFNLLPITHGAGQTSAGAYGHGAGTPLSLCRWWTRYICPPGGRILDPFAGSGTTGIAAIEHGCDYVGIERYAKYVPIAEGRLAKAGEQQRLAV